MNRLEIKGEGFPATIETFQFINEMVQQAAQLGRGFGEHIIVSGCEVTGTRVSEGYLIVRGELCRFSGGVLGTHIEVRSTAEPVTYLEDLNSDGAPDTIDTYITREAVFSDAGDEWSRFKRFEQIVQSQIEVTINDLKDGVSPSLDTLKKLGDALGRKADKEGTPKVYLGGGKPTAPTANYGDLYVFNDTLEVKTASGWNQIALAEAAAVPAGVIWMWSGAIDAVPEGWALCDGRRGTPDLRGRFIVGYDPRDADYSLLGKTGGEKAHTLAPGEMPSHGHGMSSAGGHTHTVHSGGNHRHGIKIMGINASQNWDNKKVINAVDSSELEYTEYNGSHVHTMGSAGDHTHNIHNTGGGQAHENRPPYYTLAFIIKL